MSVALLDDILADNLHGITERDLSEEEIGRVKGMIVSGKGGAPAPPGKRWLYEVLQHCCSCTADAPVDVVSRTFDKPATAAVSLTPWVSTKFLLPHSAWTTALLRHIHLSLFHGSHALLRW